MRVVARIEGDLAGFLKGEIEGLARQVTEITNREALALRDELRAQTRAAGLGGGLANAWRAEMYPRGRRASLRPAGLVFSRSTILHAAFDEGPTIVAGRKFLVIPTPEAAAMGFAETTEPRGARRIPAGAKRRYGRLQAAIAKLGAENIAMLPTKNGRGNLLVVYRPPKRRGRGRGGRSFRAGAGRGFQLLRGVDSVPLFILVHQVRVPRLLDIAAAQQRGEQRFYAALTPQERYVAEEARLRALLPELVRLTGDRARAQEIVNRAIAAANPAAQQAQQVQADALRTYTAAVQQQQRESERAIAHGVNRVVDFAADGFDRILQGGVGTWRELADSFVSIMRRAFAQSAADAFARPIIQPIVASLAGFLGFGSGGSSAAAAGGGGGVSGGSSGGFGGLSSLGNLFGGTGGTLTPGLDAWAMRNLGFGQIAPAVTQQQAIAAGISPGQMGLLNNASWRRAGIV